MHRSNTLEAIARNLRLRVATSLVILNAYAQDKIINNDPARNRKLMGHFMDELIDLPAAMAGIGSVAAGETMIVASKIVVIDGKVPNQSRAA